MNKIYWFVWWLKNYPEIVWLKIKSLFKIKNMSLKQRWLRYKVKKRNNQKEIKTIDPIEQKGIEIFISLLKDKDSVLHVAPLSGERFIENPKLEMFIILSYNKLTIINSVYQYDIRVTEKIEDQLQQQFNGVQEKRTQVVKRKSTTKVKQSLDTIIDTLKNNKSNLL
jgi:hypothetical protein